MQPAAIVVDHVVHLSGERSLPAPEFGFLPARATSFPRCGETVACPLGHQCVLEFGYRAEDLEEHPADGGGGVDGRERIVLLFGMLVAGGDPFLAHPHARTVTRTPDSVTLMSTWVPLHA